MSEFLMRVVSNMQDRVTGPLHLRIIFQPAMASFFAIRSGLRDAKLRRTPYFEAIVTGARSEAELIRSGWRNVGKIFILAMVLDLVFQIFAFHRIYPGGVVLVALILALVPYVIVRGLVARIARKR
ncbi:hypothetical protein [Paraburkholderia oxyphila]|uniref:hypothetical protein n=1 Tax=Paraburkholderia oxyphila TaxID=614212 RepID=UPI00047F2C30|nr:hypothetical protein [Paraburkholderia oxyphila]